MFQTRTPTADERAWLNWVIQLPCIVCKRFHAVLDTPCEVHHCDGRMKPECHLKTIPLCCRHHRIQDDHPKRWISRHGDGRGRFEAYYAQEQELIVYTLKEVEKLKMMTVGDKNYESD